MDHHCFMVREHVKRGEHSLNLTRSLIVSSSAASAPTTSVTTSGCSPTPSSLPSSSLHSLSSSRGPSYSRTVRYSAILNYERAGKCRCHPCMVSALISRKCSKTEDSQDPVESPSRETYSKPTRFESDTRSKGENPVQFVRSSTVTPSYNLHRATKTERQ